MGIVGAYLMLFSMLKENELLNWIGLALVTAGFVLAAIREDYYDDRLKRLEKVLPTTDTIIAHKTDEEEATE